MVTLAARISSVLQLIVLASTTVLGLLIRHGPVYVVSFVPAGTPVLLGLGQGPPTGGPMMTGPDVRRGLLVGAAERLGLTEADAEGSADAEADASGLDPGS